MIYYVEFEMLEDTNDTAVIGVVTCFSSAWTG
jgi:hypothetical protein